ncbi:alpha/beta fold hydrolase [Paraburkholderia sp. RL17-347-BIC-D]|uniref:alpha/beta fold hydrolase n=1 Tax=Paraburkholderia sp. RL17-347-BIC-D TaxID=3031632 RepID=UPI0038BA53A1
MATAIGVSVRDTVLWVEDTGETGLPVVLCLHSLWLDRTMFDDFVKAANGKFRLIRPDFRGQGKSAPPTTKAISMETCAEDIEALIDNLELKSVNLLVQSMGGDVALRLAARRPELFRSLVMLGSSAREEPPEQITWVHKWLDDASATGFVGESLDLLMEVMFGKTTRANPAMQPVLAHWRAKMEASPLSLWPAIIGVIERKSAVPLLPVVTTPALIFSGQEDMPRPPAWADEVVGGLPRAKLIRLAGIGHSPIIEAPAIVIPQILAFFDQPHVE